MRLLWASVSLCSNVTIRASVLKSTLHTMGATAFSTAQQMNMSFMGFGEIVPFKSPLSPPALQFKEQLLFLPDLRRVPFGPSIWDFEPGESSMWLKTGGVVFVIVVKAGCGPGVGGARL